MGLNNVRAMKEEDAAICCCLHDHKTGCLWKIFEGKYGHKAAHNLHTANCLCYDPTKVSNITVISHNPDCKYYITFVKKL